MASWTRNTVDPEKAEKAKKAQKQKRDTIKWCGGKESKLHKLTCVTSHELADEFKAFKDWRSLECTVCGKQIDYYTPVFTRPETLWKPTWVTN